MNMVALLMFDDYYNLQMITIFKHAVEHGCICAVRKPSLMITKLLDVCFPVLSVGLSQIGFIMIDPLISQLAGTNQ